MVLPAVSVLSLGLRAEPRTPSRGREAHPLGTWTMIYDEGFEVELGHLNFFAFSRLGPEISECGPSRITENSECWIICSHVTSIQISLAPYSYGLLTEFPWFPGRV